MIRPATTADIPAIVELGSRFFAESPAFAPLGYSATKIDALVRRLIGDPCGFVRVIEREGELLGGMMGMVSEHLASDAIVATELVLFVSPGARGNVWAARLAQQFLEWARDAGAVRCYAGTSSGVQPELCARLYERLGFTRHSIGMVYAYV